jgi:tripartite-type tricarboxylate transporter receptor subunit TctC
MAAAEEIDGQVKSGTVRVLAATSTERSKYYPDVPTLKEKGINAIVTNMKGLVAPASLPQEIADYLHERFHKAMENKVWKDFAERVGEPTNYQDGAAFQASQTEQLERIRAALHN